MLSEDDAFDVELKDVLPDEFVEELAAILSTPTNATASATIDKIINISFLKIFISDLIIFLTLIQM